MNVFVYQLTETRHRGATGWRVPLLAEELQYNVFATPWWCALEQQRSRIIRDPSIATLGVRAVVISH